MCWKISYRIEMICKNLGINYHSPYLEIDDVHKDAIKLQELYHQLKQIVSEIIEVADKHGGEKCADQLWRYVNLIEGVDHQLSYMAAAMEKENKHG